MTDQLYANHSIIVNLDVDKTLANRLEQVVKAGFSKIEINSSNIELLQNLKSQFAHITLGAGNIISTQQLEDAYSAGVDFITSPGFLPAIAQTAAIYSIDYVPGVATISEAMQAYATGCKKVRPYPANLAFCSSLGKAIPDLRMYPAEVEWEEAEHYLTLPSVTAVSILNPQSKQLDALVSVAAIA